MRARTILLGWIATVAVLGGCDRATNLLEPDSISPSGGQVVGSGNVIAQSRNVSGFEAVSFEGVARLVLEQTGTESLTISADDNILPLLISEVREGTLFLGFASDTNITDTEPIVFTLSVRTLTRLTAAGVVEVDARGIDTGRLDVTVAGVSNVSAAGRADRQNVVVSGVSTYLAENLESRVVVVDVSGPSRVVVNVSEELRGEVSAPSLVEYIGDPTVDVEGLGAVQKR